MKKDILIYTLGNALNKSCALLVFPMYAKILSTGEFATQDLILSQATFVMLFMSLGLANGYARNFHELTTQERDDLATTWISAVLISISVVFALTAVFIEPMVLFLSNNAESKNLILMALAGAAFQSISQQPLMKLRMEKKSIHFAAASILNTLGHAFFIFLFVRHQEQGAAGVINAYTAASLSSLFIYTSFSGWMWRGKFSKKLLRELTHFSLPLLPATLSLMAFSYFNRVILNNTSSDEEVAIYGIGLRISRILEFLMLGFQLSWGPVAFEAMKDLSKAKLLYEKASRNIFYFCGLGCLMISLFSPELILLFSKKSYLGAAKIVPILVLGSLIWNFYYIACVGFQYAKKTYHQSISMLAGLFALLLLSNFLIPKIGAFGAALSTLSAYTIALLYALYASAKFIKIEYQWTKLLGWLIPIVALNLLYSKTPIESSLSIQKIVFKIGVIGLFSGLGYFLLLKEKNQFERP